MLHSQFQPVKVVSIDDLSPYQQLNAYLQMLMMPNTSAFTIDDDITKMHLTLPAGKVFVQGKALSKLTLYYSTGPMPGMDPRFSAMNKSRVIVTLKDGQKYYLDFSPQMGLPIRMQFQMLLMNLGASIEVAFYNQSKRLDDMIDWTKATTDKISAAIEDKRDYVSIFYNRSRSHVAEVFAQALDENGSLFEKAQASGVQVFSFGCGDGQDIIHIHEKLAAMNFDLKCFGMDINQGNFAKIGQQCPVEFDEHDVNDLQSWLPQRAEKDSAKLALFSGILTQGVSKSTYDVLKCVHQVRDFDYVYITGYTPVYLSQRIAKAAGWLVSLKQTNSHLEDAPEKRVIKDTQRKVLVPDCRSHYMLTPMNPEQRKQYLEKRGTKRSSSNEFNCLDISYSSKPLTDLQLVTDSLENFKQIDISWSHFSEQEFATFMARLDEARQESVFLIASGDEPWFNHFEAMENDKFKLRQRLDHKTNELAPFASKTAKGLGVFVDGKFPNKPL